ncbi:UPF0481 protein At3g47200-like [Telopea speciosissima]|uniref:UPF0481 protein At3g47200-like n=1 Tax=Telopea speciosissima TaxID=54955 RepID=UPI001CC66E89|nr:UPF0481 protein At3g47200-like [Telopea speciosissima]
MANATTSCLSEDSTTLIKKEEEDDCQVNNNNEEIRILVESMELKLKKVVSNSLLQSDYDRVRVPEQLYKLKPEAYTPHSVSIGPLHYNERHLRTTMEIHKLRYLNLILNQAPSGKTLDVYVKAVSDLEEEARKCYSISSETTTTTSIGKREFVEMMVMDSFFILGFLGIFELSEKDQDHFGSRSSRGWAIMDDLIIKLENQLPFFILEHLHGLIFDGFIRLPRGITLSHYIYWELLHWCEDMLHGPTLESYEQILSLPLPSEGGGGAKHFLHLLHFVLVPSSLITMMRNHNGKEYLPLRYCASELWSSGVKFQNKKKEKDSRPPKTSSSLFDIYRL